MKNLQSFEEFINENLLNEGALAVVPKDWDRMLDLVVKGDDGSKAAKLITAKGKAIARFVAGLKLSNSKLDYRYNQYLGDFGEIGNKAIQLGATQEEIQDLYDATELPSGYIEKINKLEGKKLKNRFVGDISNAILKLGFDINYLPHNGYAMTNDGQAAMSRNGRKWTIGYKSEIDLGDKKVTFNFDAITDEGGGSTYYVIDYSSDGMFDFARHKAVGKNEFISTLKGVLTAYKENK
jgi:hypothetical protein